MSTRHKLQQNQRDSQIPTSSKKPTRKTNKSNDEIIGKDNEIENVLQTINKLQAFHTQVLYHILVIFSNMKVFYQGRQIEFCLWPKNN